jgi:hypothetical protein
LHCAGRVTAIDVFIDFCSRGAARHSHGDSGRSSAKLFLRSPYQCEGPRNRAHIPHRTSWKGAMSVSQGLREDHLCQPPRFEVHAAQSCETTWCVERRLVPCHHTRSSARADPIMLTSRARQHGRENRQWQGLGPKSAKRHAEHQKQMLRYMCHAWSLKLSTHEQHMEQSDLTVIYLHHVRIDWRTTNRIMHATPPLETSPHPLESHQDFQTSYQGSFPNERKKTSTFEGSGGAEASQKYLSKHKRAPRTRLRAFQRLKGC